MDLTVFTEYCSTHPMINAFFFIFDRDLRLKNNLPREAERVIDTLYEDVCNFRVISEIINRDEN